MGWDKLAGVATAQKFVQRLVVTPTLCLDDPPELDGKGNAVEEGGGEADDDGRGEQGAAAAGVQEGHRQRTPQNSQNFPKPQILMSLTVQGIHQHFAPFPLSLFKTVSQNCPQPLVLLPSQNH